MWTLCWPVPTEVEGQGVLLYPDNVGVLNARSGGQLGGAEHTAHRRLRFAGEQPIERT